MAKRAAITEQVEQFLAAMLTQGSPSAAYRQVYDTTGMSAAQVYHAARRILTNPDVARAYREAILDPDGLRMDLGIRLRELLGIDLADYEPWLQGQTTLQELRDSGIPTWPITQARITRSGRSIERTDILQVMDRIVKLFQLANDTLQVNLTFDEVVQDMVRQGEQVLSDDEDGDQ